jgi:predicted MFS family arabinose efflux permease
MPIGLVALALGGFGIGLTEFVIMGLLPEVAADFAVTEATAGWLISGYALAVVVGALLLTAAVTRFDRKPVLAVLLVLFVAGNLISAIAPGYGMMMAGRVIAALAHGAFFGIGAVVAADMVAPTKKAGFALTAGNQPLTMVAIVLMGGFGFATVPGLQMRVMKYASKAPTLASGANIGAFNVGNVSSRALVLAPADPRPFLCMVPRLLVGRAPKVGVVFRGARHQRRSVWPPLASCKHVSTNL